MLSLSVTACQSYRGSRPPGTLTTITVTKRAGEQIGKALQAVLTAHGFQGGQSGENLYSFKRMSSRQGSVPSTDSTIDELAGIGASAFYLKQIIPATAARAPE